ncbi:MAG: methylmalonyl-CoA mutase family protein [Cyclobacteriaceae bacterium]
MSSTYKSSIHLFSDFPRLSKNEWLEKAAQGLSSSDFQALLEGAKREGIRLKTFYHQDDLSRPFPSPAFSAKMKDSRGWAFQEKMPVCTPGKEKIINKVALKALEGGAEGLLFVIDNQSMREFDWKQLLKDILTDAISISWLFRGKVPFSLFQDFPDMKGSIMLAADKWTFSQQAPVSDLIPSVHELMSQPPTHYRCLSVDATFLANAGAQVVQEVGVTLSLLLAFYDRLTDLGHKIEQLIPHTSLSLGTGSSYLVDMARYRAYRRLLVRLAKAYGVEAAAYDFELRAETSAYNKVSYDQNMNILRNTTEAMAAAYGGCDQLCLMPHDGQYGESNHFARRIARNISHLLREESRAHLVSDPAAGAYAIEQLTDEIGEKAWSYFLMLEEKGGFEQAWHSGFIEEELRASARLRQQSVDKQQQVLVGANRYIDWEKSAHVADRPQAGQDGLIQRLSASFESLRFEMDELAVARQRPTLLLQPVCKSDKTAFVNARTAFVEDLFASVGIATSLADTYLEDQLPGKHLLNDKIGLVLLAEDATYADFLSGWSEQQFAQLGVPLFIAGHPSRIAVNTEAFQFIYKGMEVPAFARSILKKAKIIKA